MRNTNLLPLPLPLPAAAAATILVLSLIICLSDAVVLDTNGKPVKTGKYYHVLPYSTLNAGGLLVDARATVADKGAKCPATLHVAQKPKSPYHYDPRDNGTPVKILSPTNHAKTGFDVQENADFQFMFKGQGDYKCQPPRLLWKMDLNPSGVSYVTVAPNSTAYRNVNTKFRILKAEREIGLPDNVYKFRFCPAKGKVCGDVGFTREWRKGNYQQWLMVLKERFSDRLGPVTFSPASSSDSLQHADA